MAAENYTTYTEVDPSAHITVAATSISFSGLTRNEDAYVYKDMGAGNIGNYVVHQTVSISSTGLASGSFVTLWGVSDTLNDMNQWTEGHTVTAYHNGTILTLGIAERPTGAAGDTSITILANTTYYLTIARYGGMMGLMVYSDVSRTTIVGSCWFYGSNATFRYQYALASYNSGHAYPITGSVAYGTLDPAVVGTPGGIEGDTADHDGWEETAGGGVIRVDYSNFFRFGYYSGYGYCSAYTAKTLAAPQGATIIGYAAKWTRNITRAWSTSGTLYGIDEDNASMPTPGNWATRWAARTLTTASKAYSFPSGSANNAVTLPNCRDIVQEIVNRAGWSSGNNIGLFFYITASGGDTTQYVDSVVHATAGYRPKIYSIFVNPPSSPLDYTDFTVVDPNTRLTVGSSQITVTSVPRNEDCYAYYDLGAGGIDSISMDVDFQITTPPTPGAGGMYHLFGVSNYLDDVSGWSDGLWVRAYYYQPSAEYRLYMNEVGSSQQLYVIAANTTYYLRITRTGTAFEVQVYSDAARLTLLSTLSLAVAATTYRYLYAMVNYNSSTTEAISGVIYNLEGSPALPVSGGSLVVPTYFTYLLAGGGR